MDNNKKKKLIIGVIVGVLVLTLGGSFALWAYSKIGQNQLLVAGDIYMKYTGTNTMNVQNVVPTDTYNKSDYFEFTVEGKNTYSKDIIYDIVLDHGDEPTGEDNENRNVRIDDKFLNFRLVKVTGEDSEEELIQEGNYENIIQKRIWVDRISANTIDETSVKYRLYVWISSEIKIGNTEDADYEMNTWNNNVFASIKVVVTGDFAEKGLDDEEESTLELIEEEGVIETNEETTFIVTANTEGTFSVITDEPSIATASLKPETGTMTTVIVNAVGMGTTNIKVNFKPKSAKYKETNATYSITVGKKLLDKINEKLDDTNSVNDGETTYLSGDNDTINFNYVWYSGKIWRITAINKDDTMKMITQDGITAIHWGEDTKYEDSWVYQWLNEDFLDTLENWENVIVKNAKWNVTQTTSSTSKPSETTPPLEGNIGLLNTYEYYQSYKTTTSQDGYLNIGYWWWLITPYDDMNVWDVSRTSDMSYYPAINNAHEIRPSVNLKSDIKISGGNGTKENPYRIEEDKNAAKVNDKLNSRVSGEYVKFDGKIYRIVATEKDANNNLTTKLTSVDYVRDNSGAVMTKYFSSGTTNYAEVGTSTDYWTGYLNDTTKNGWYGSLSTEYKNMLVEGTYYLGTLGYDNQRGIGNYKNSICSEFNTVETTKTCNKTSATWKGYVGLPRVGEMFSAQLEKGYSASSEMWLITPYDNSRVWFVRNYGMIMGGRDTCISSSNSYAVRPSITLNSNVYITSGKGTEQKPYEIKCDSCSVN